MRTISAALMSACAALPLLARAATVVPEPIDAGASVPVIAVPSAFDGYKSWQDVEAPSWQELNRAVTTDRGVAGMRHGQQSGATSGRSSNREHGGDAK
ncbi:hypothetical protein [Paraburkholderia sp. J10-1]|uniref:hypothetical protein n=1 Tax=Paraburkholderia sp. J10-1 TaxID=2805430 RepID=UPI002AB6E2FC|nr:hypothetical protein [Paraburkholderia sp. J10-1]